MEKQKSFALGYSLVVHSILMYFITGAFTTSGMNVWNAAFSGAHGWDTSTLLTMCTIGGLVGVLGTIIFGNVVAKKGARPVIAICVIICGIAVMFFGYVPSIACYAIWMIIFNVTANGFCSVASNAVIGNWFPKRKGFILGITTMGLPLASCAFVPILSALLGTAGLQKSFLIIGAVVIVLGIVSWFWVRNTPQEVGLLPDNGKYPEANQLPQGQTSEWTIKKLLAHKNTWFISLAYGLLFLVTMGMVSQTVVYLVQHGFALQKSVSMLSIAAAVGIVGSFIWGVLDDKFGTKLASIVYCIWYIVTFAILALAQGPAILIVGVIMLGASLGGIGNLMPSMIMTAFGVTEFAAASRVVQTIVSIVRALSFAVMALGLKLFGNYADTAWILLGLTVIALILVLLIQPAKKVQ